MVEELRNKWCDDLEDLLACPICMVRPKSWIYQCVQGHNVCMDCKTQLSSCPTCTQRWSSARNRFAESLCTKLDEIKLSLIDPGSEINKLLIPDRVSVSTQTDNVTIAPNPGSPNKIMDGHSGPYQCKIGSCNLNVFYTPLMNHLKTDHASHFIELPPGDGAVFQHMWFFNFTELLVFDRAFLVPEKGTFFLKLSSDCFGNLTGFVLMLHNGFIAKQFTYQLEISCCADHDTRKSFTGEMSSCRTPVTVLKDKCLQINRADIQRMLDHQHNLTCTVLIGKKPQMECQNASSRPNNQKKKFPFNKNHTGKASQTNNQNGAGPSSSGYQHMPNRNRRPQTAPNGQQNQQGHQGQQGYHRRQQGNEAQQRTGDLQPVNPRFEENRYRPSITGSIPSLLYPNLRDMN